jgi:hypothetical protein
MRILVATVPPMFGILAMIVVIAGGWWLLSPTMRFLSGFSGLLDNPRIDRGPLRFFLGRSFVNGTFGGRAVHLQLTHPYEHRIGEIVVSIEAHAPPGEPWKDSTEISGHPEISRATYDLEGRYELILTTADGWLRATSRPPFVRFPGRFDPARWRSTLVNMRALAEWLEKRR